MMKLIISLIISFVTFGNIKPYSYNSYFVPTAQELEICNYEINETIENNCYQDEQGQSRIEEKVRKIVFNGSNNETYWVSQTDDNSYTTVRFALTNLILTPNIKSMGLIYSKNFENNSNNNLDKEIIYIHSNNYIYLRISKSKLIGYNTELTSNQKLELFKTYLQQNPLEVTYQLANSNTRLLDSILVTDISYNSYEIDYLITNLLGSLVIWFLGFQILKRIF